MSGHRGRGWRGTRGFRVWSEKAVAIESMFLFYSGSLRALCGCKWASVLGVLGWVAVFDGGCGGDWHCGPELVRARLNAITPPHALTPAPSRPPFLFSTPPTQLGSNIPRMLPHLTVSALLAASVLGSPTPRPTAPGTLLVTPLTPAHSTALSILASSDCATYHGIVGVADRLALFYAPVGCDARVGGGAHEVPVGGGAREVPVVWGEGEVIWAGQTEVDESVSELRDRKTLVEAAFSQAWLSGKPEGLAGRSQLAFGLERSHAPRLVVELEGVSRPRCSRQTTQPYGWITDMLVFEIRLSSCGSSPRMPRSSRGRLHPPLRSTSSSQSHQLPYPSPPP